MKLTWAMLPVIASMLSSAHATVIALEVGVSAIASAAKSFDIDGDGTTDFTFSGNGGVCTADVPTSTCVFAVTIQARSGIDFLLDSALSDSARPLVTGDILGPSSTGIWGSTSYFSLHVAYVTNSLVSGSPNSGYPDYLDGFDVYSIGFRQLLSGGEPRYGWVDVRLSMPVTGGGGYTTGGITTGAIQIPQVLGIHFSDAPGNTVEFTPVPEVSPAFLLVLSGVLALTQRNRRTSRPS